MVIDIIRVTVQILSLLVGVAGGLGLWKYVHWRRREKQTALEYLKGVIGTMQSLVDSSDPHDYVSLECVNEDGILVELAIFKDIWCEIPPGGISMTLMNRCAENTVCALRCPMAQSVPLHSHRLHAERVYVMAGLVDEIGEDGNVLKTYHAGETWEIPKDTKHSATFRNCLCNLTYMPPLPTGAEKPANLELALAALEKLL